MTEVIAYRLVRVHETPPGGIATAAVMTCMASGRMLSGMGGGGEFLSPEVVDALRDGGRGCVVCDAALFDGLVELARRAASGDPVQDRAAEIVKGWPDVV